MENKVQSSHVIGWRVDLVRHHLFWKGNQYLHAKLEFFTLLLKAQSLNLNIDVHIYTDPETMDRFYKRWLEEEGYDLSALMCIHIIHLKQDCWELEEWLSVTSKQIEVQWEKDLRCLDTEFPPDHIYKYIQGQDDSVLAIWS